eukprot:910003-Pelagomonas_calceolata.AAC.4
MASMRMLQALEQRTGARNGCVHRSRKSFGGCKEMQIEEKHLRMREEGPKDPSSAGYGQLSSPQSITQHQREEQQDAGRKKFQEQLV